jgi:hypothetical protein
VLGSLVEVIGHKLATHHPVIEPTSTAERDAPNMAEKIEL